MKETYWNRENFIIDFYKVNYYKDAETLVNYSIQKFSVSRLEEVNTLGQMFQSSKYEIINVAIKTTYGMRMTNFIAVSNNNFIQTFIDSCYGLVNFERMRKRILMMSREKAKLNSKKM